MSFYVYFADTSSRYYSVQGNISWQSGRIINVLFFPLSFFEWLVIEWERSLWNFRWSKLMDNWLKVKDNFVIFSEDRIPVAQIKETTTGPIVAEFDWSVSNLRHLMQLSHSPHGDTVPGPEFYTGRPGYKVRLSITTGRINPADGMPYLGVWWDHFVLLISNLLPFHSFSSEWVII